MEEKKKVNIIISGRVYTLVGTETEEHMHKVASLIDKKIDEIKGAESSNYLSTNLISILTSINIADLYLKEKEKVDELKKSLDKYRNEIDRIKELEKIILQYDDEINKLKTESLSLQELNENLNLELSSVKKDLNELLNT